MAVNLKQLTQNEDLLAGGHRACAGCTGANILRQIMLTAGKDTVMGGATGCMEVITTIFPYTAWKTSFIHSAFENCAATISGVETAFRSLKKHGELPVQREKMNFIAFGGDGGTYDIGLQSLSGAMERGHNMLYVCYDNEAYMNTGIQRSSATPWGAWTTTTPAQFPEATNKKDILAIMAAHSIPYAATATPAYPADLLEKVNKAKALRGTRFLHFLSPCPPGWKCGDDEGLELARMAVQARVFPMLEVENGQRWRMTMDHAGERVEPYLRRQGRFRHLSAEQVTHIQAEIDARWEQLLRRVDIQPLVHT